ncbi:MAG: hypothetical protein KBS36_03490 [Bacteroidales bacterium]|nr:hypothetical protein [Candidatus Cryptobacteroides fimicaballi]
MKRSIILLLVSGLMAVSCATTVRISSIEPLYQDGIYYKPKLKTAPLSKESFQIQPADTTIVLYSPSVTFAVGIPVWRNWWWNDPFYWDPWYSWDPWYRWNNWYRWDPWYRHGPYYDPWWHPAHRPVIIDRSRYYYGSRSSVGIGGAARHGGAGYVRRGGSSVSYPGYSGGGGYSRSGAVSSYSGSNVSRNVSRSTQNRTGGSSWSERSRNSSSGSYSGRSRTYTGSSSSGSSSRSSGYSGGSSFSGRSSFSGGGSSMRSGGGGHSSGRR